MSTAEKAKQWATQAQAAGMPDLAAALIRFAEREKAASKKPENKSCKASTVAA